MGNRLTFNKVSISTLFQEDRFLTTSKETISQIQRLFLGRAC